MRALLALLLTASVLCAQTNPVRPVQHTNGRVVSPTNFWTANASNINAVVTNAGGGGGATTNASLLTTGTLADARLSSNVALLPNLPGWATNTNAQTAEAALFSNGLTLPSVATTNAGDLYRLTNTLRFRDSTNGERILLNNADNLANLTSPAAARTNLGVTVASNLPAPWSGAAASNAILRADGAGGSAFVADTFFLARQTTNGPVVTNGAATTSLTISNIPAGLYWVQGQLTSTSTGSRLFQLSASHQVLGPRNLLGWFDSGAASGFFNNATNMHNNSDAATGTRNASITGPLLFTNTATVSFFVSVTGATNTAQILSNSFLFLRKLD